MKNFFLFLFFILSYSLEVSPATSTEASPKTNTEASIIDKRLYDYNLKMADNLYLHHDFDRNLPLAIKYYQNALAIDHQKADAYWRLARALWVKQEKTINKKEKKDILKKGKAYIKQALANHPQNIDVRLWSAIINGSNLMQSNFLESLLFLTDNIKQDLEFVISKRKNSERATCALGVYYLELPVVLGGSLEKSIAFFRQSLEYNPLFHRANLLLAKAYFKNNQPLLARKNLDIILQSNKSEESGFLILFQQEARLLLQEQ